MKYVYGIPKILTFLFLCIPCLISAQGQITSVAPSAVYPGQVTDIIINAMGTSFKSGVTVVNFGAGITAGKADVINSETIYVNVTVSNSAQIGSNDVTVTTGKDVVVKQGAIQIFSLGSGVKATILVTPAQTIHLSDFDPNNVANAPLLFTATIYNDAVVQDLTVVFTFTGQKMGEIVTATKVFKSEPADKIESITNRQFDKYQVSNTNTPALQAAIQTGTLPADVYDYHIQVLDANGKDVADADGTNTIINQQSKPILISPGSSFSTDPELIHSSQPLFEWFAQANSVNLNLYEVYPGQTTAPAVALNRPTFTISDINSSTFLYPAGATILEVGHTYAWQITANYSSVSGSSTLSSDLNWFTVSNSNNSIGKHTLSQMSVSPSEITMGPGQSYKFTAKGYDANNDTISIQPTWTVVPADGGNIDYSGNFTSNNNEASVAIIASCGEIKDYATVYISSGIGANGALWDVNAAMRQIFGLPQK